MVHTRPSWQRALSAPRRLAASLTASDLPTAPGVYIWFRDGEPVYAGRAKGRRGLRERLGKHLATGRDLSRSTLRATVAVRQLGVSRAVARARPTVMTAEQIDVVNAWVAGCEVAWVECTSADETIALEKALLDDWRPPLNIL